MKKTNKPRPASRVSAGDAIPTLEAMGRVFGASHQASRRWVSHAAFNVPGPPWSLTGVAKFLDTIGSPYAPNRANARRGRADWGSAEHTESLANTYLVDMAALVGTIRNLPGVKVTDNAALAIADHLHVLFVKHGGHHIPRDQSFGDILASLQDESKTEAS